MKLKTILTHPLGVVLTAVFCSVLWGSAFPVLKITYAEMGLSAEDFASKILLAGIRFFLAGIILLFGVIIIFRKRPVIDRPLWYPVLLLGILQITLQYFFFYNGLANTSGIKGAILQSSGIFLVVLFAHFVYQNDKLNWKKIVGLVSGFSGIVLVNYGQGVNLNFKLTGEGFLILAGLTTALSTILAKKLTKDINPFLLTGWQMTLGALILIVFGYLYIPAPLQFNILSGSLLIYSAFLSATAFSLWYALLKYNKAGEISIFKFMIPVSGVILSSIFIPGEYLTVLMLGALILVAAGIIAVNHRKG